MPGIDPACRSRVSSRAHRIAASRISCVAISLICTKILGVLCARGQQLVADGLRMMLGTRIVCALLVIRLEDRKPSASTPEG